MDTFDTQMHPEDFNEEMEIQEALADMRRDAELDQEFLSAHPEYLNKDK